MNYEDGPQDKNKNTIRYPSGCSDYSSRTTTKLFKRYYMPNSSVVLCSRSTSTSMAKNNNANAFTISTLVIISGTAMIEFMVKTLRRHQNRDRMSTNL